MERPQTAATNGSKPVHASSSWFVMESRVNTCRTILAAAAVAALAGNASLAQHGGGKSAPGHGAAHHQGSAPGASEGVAIPGKIAPIPASEIETGAGRPSLPATVNGGANKKGGGEVGHDAGLKASGAVAKTGAAVRGIDLVRPDGGYASLRRRATRSSLIANAAKKVPTIVAPGNIAVHAPISLPAVAAKNAIGVTAPSTGIQNLAVAHPSMGVTVNGNTATGYVAKTSIGGNAGEVRHENLPPVPKSPVPLSGAIHATGLSGTTMGHPTVNAAALGGPAHNVSGIGGASIRPRY
jgi:hypothetical protein